MTWDSATLGRDIGFASMFDWVEQAVRLAAPQELVLVVRIHPAEKRWGTREEVHEIVVSRLGEVPANVRFVHAQDALSTYALMDISNLLLTYATTVGLEAAVRGKQVAVAGATHYRGRGFTTDISSPEDLAHVLRLEPTRASPGRRGVGHALRPHVLLPGDGPIPADRIRWREGDALPA